MILNSVNIFGNQSGGNGAASLAALIIFVVLLFIALIVLCYLLFKQVRVINATYKDYVEEKTVVVEETAPVVAEAEPEKVVTNNTTIIERTVVIVKEAPAAETAAEEPQEMELIEEVQEEPVEEVIYEEVKEEPKEEPKQLQEAAAAEDDGDESEGEEIEDIIPDEDIEAFRMGRLTYNKSYLAKYIQLDDAAKEWYAQIKNELKSYERVRERISWRRETFRIGRKVVARLAVRGKTLCIYLPLDPQAYDRTDYTVEDASDVSYYADTPCMYRVRSDQRLKFAFELIEDVMTDAGAEKGEVIPQDYYLPYENLPTLIEKGLIRKVYRT